MTMRREIKVAVNCDQGHHAVVACWVDYAEPFKLAPKNLDDLMCPECRELVRPSGWTPGAAVV